MTRFLFWVLAIIIFLIAPVIPYEEEKNSGVIEVKSKSVAVYVLEKYQENQK